jgi:vacuolar protein sorting-associated protein 41
MDFRNDRSYLSGGLAGSLVLTAGGRAGTSENSSTNPVGGAAAVASNWLGTIGLGSSTGKDTVLHSGEGAISTIKWSLSGRYVLWVNEQGIKIMRSNLLLDSGESDFAWKRISHIDRPNRPGWEEMAGVWKARAEWIDQDSLESDDDRILGRQASHVSKDSASSKSKLKESNRPEKVVVGWGGTVWIINVFPGGTGTSKAGRAEVGTM